MRKLLRAAVAVSVMVTALAWTASISRAHHPEITLEAIPNCDTNEWVLKATVTAWETGDPDRRHNNAIGLSGAITTQDGFNASNGYMFMASTLVGPGTYTVRATALVAWGVNENLGSAGSFREASLTIEGEPPCENSTPTPTPIPTATPPPTTPIPEPTPSLTPEPTLTPTPIITATPSPTAPSSTPPPMTPTPEEPPSEPTPTESPTPTPTPPPTSTTTPAPSPTPTSTPSVTPVPSPSPTPGITPSPSPTPTMPPAEPSPTPPPAPTPTPPPELADSGFSNWYALFVGLLLIAAGGVILGMTWDEK